MSQKIVVLGSTGSVGQQVLALIKNNPEFKVLGLSGFSNTRLLKKQLKTFDVPYYFSDKKFTDHKFLELRNLASLKKADLVVNAIVGSAGLEASMATLKAGKKLLLANKEVMVIAGKKLMNLAKKHQTEIIPLDSEINAIWQCLQGENHSSIRKVILTCSGGPFYDWPVSKMKNVSVKQATTHPRWKMGKKISVDSATLMNKGLEMIEAAHFFNLKPEQIEVLIHRASIVHALVEFTDGNTKAIMYAPDMKTAISSALGFPTRQKRKVSSITDLLKTHDLCFETVDKQKFHCLKMAEDALKKGLSAQKKLNQANEIAVKKFLAGEIQFHKIAQLIKDLR